MRYINVRFNYLLTYLLTYIPSVNGLAPSYLSQLVPVSSLIKYIDASARKIACFSTAALFDAP